MNKTRMSAAAVGVGALAVALSVGVVGADEATSPPSLSFPLTTVVYGEPGSVYEILSADVPADQAGLSCTVTTSSANNPSVHPDSDLLVTSGDEQIVLSDVESAPDGTKKVDGTLTLSTTVSVSVRLGADGVFSAGGAVVFDCVAPETTTTTTTAPEAEVQAETTVPSAAAAAAAAPQFTG